MAPVRIPGPGDVSGVGIARDPGGRATAQQFGAGIGEAAAGLSGAATDLSAVVKTFYEKRKAVEDDIFEQRDLLEANTLAAKGYLNLQGDAGRDPDTFPDRVGATLQAGFGELDKKYANEGIRISAEARQRMALRRGEILQDYTLKGVGDAHNARIVSLGQTLDTNLTQIGTGLAVSGDIAGASDQAERALASMSQLVDPANLDKARQAAKTNLGSSVVSYLNTLQDEAVGAPADEREFYVTKGHSLIDQAVAKGWIDPAKGEEAKREWAKNYKIRIIDSLKDNPQEIRRLLGDVPLHGGARRPDAISGLRGDFAGTVSSLISSAPPNIQGKLGLTSAYRSEEVQAQLYKDDIAKNGGKPSGTVAPPGHSQHEEGEAVDISWDGHLMRSSNTPPEVIAWVHENGAKMGLHFPVKGEPWHAEPIDSRSTISTHGGGSRSILQAMEYVESGGDPNARSSAGAIGLMQVMPGTGAEIARELGDVNFPTTGQADVAKYLSDPAVSRRYGAHYFNKMLGRYGEDEIAALIAYNAGPAVADRWLASGEDNSVLPQETREYVGKVRAAMGGDVSISAHGSEGQVDSFFADLPADVRMTQILAARADQGRLSDEYVSGIEDYGAFLRSGGTPDGRYTNEEVVYQLGLEKGAEVAEGLTRAAEYGEKVNALRMASPAEVTAMLAQEKADLSSPEDFRVNAAEYEGVAKATQARNTAIAADPGGYVTEYDPRTKAAYEAMQAAPTSLSRVPGGPSVPAPPTVATNNYALSTLAAQKKLGVPASMQSILPKTEVAAIAEQFTFQPDGGTNAAQVMQDQEAKWGKHWPQVFSQLAREGNLPGVAMVVGTLDRPGQEQAAKQLAQAANMGVEGLKKAIPDAASKKIDSPDDGVEPLMEELRASLAFNGTSGVTTFNAFSESARLLSMHYVYQGDEPSNAMTRAVNDIINKGYTFPDVNGKTIRVPIEQDEGTIQSAAETALGSLDGMGLQLPVDDFGLDEDQTRESYTNSVRANGFWVTSEDEGGLTLYDGRGVPVIRTNGTPLTMTWQNLVTGQIAAADTKRAAPEKGLVPPTPPPVYSLPGDYVPPQ